MELINKILVDNPNKANVEAGRKLSTRLANCTGLEIEGFFEQNKFFESEDIFKERKKSQSNKDVFARVLQKESMVFSARGGSVFYDGLTPEQTKKLDEYLFDIREGMNLRKWIETVALKAYEVDPNGLIFIEKDSEGKAYPTYKSIHTIHDYKLSGQSVDYVSFFLTIGDVVAMFEAKGLPITDSELNGYNKTQKSKYYRFVDDKDDIIAKVDNKTVTVIDELSFAHGFEICPAIVVSNIQKFDNSQQRLSKLDNLIELAEMYQNDRSIRNLSKLYGGFPKLVQPIVRCSKCQGSGYIGDVMCADCNGTGFKKIKKVSDTIDIPLDMLAENPSLDIKKIFTYITPDIATWTKQDDSLNDLENRLTDTYWGTDNRKFTSGASVQSDVKETATKTMTNLQPVYARLEQTAEWAERIEKEIISFVGFAMFGKSLKSVMVKYGRDYILESTNEIFEQYLSYKTQGAPQYVLNDYLDRYLRSLYQNNPIELGIALKVMEVEPFVHYTLKDCIDMQIPNLETKIYFSDWYNSVKNEHILVTNVEALKLELKKFAESKKTI